MILSLYSLTDVITFCVIQPSHRTQSSCIRMPSLLSSPGRRWVRIIRKALTSHPAGKVPWRVRYVAPGNHGYVSTLVWISLIQLLVRWPEAVLHAMHQDTAALFLRELGRKKKGDLEVRRQRSGAEE